MSDKPDLKEVEKFNKDQLKKNRNKREESSSNQRSYCSREERIHWEMIC